MYLRAYLCTNSSFLQHPTWIPNSNPSEAIKKESKSKVPSNTYYNSLLSLSLPPRLTQTPLPQSISQNVSSEFAWFFCMVFLPLPSSLIALFSTQYLSQQGNLAELGQGEMLGPMTPSGGLWERRAHTHFLGHSIRPVVFGGARIGSCEPREQDARICSGLREA